jgi:demethylspheroidene O-methyltransferase
VWWPASRIVQARMHWDNRLSPYRAPWFRNTLHVALPSFLLRLRNRYLADPKFLAFAQKFPLTRPVARARSVELFDLLAGFSYSQVLYACVTLRVLEHVGQAGCSPADLAAKVDLPLRKVELLVRAAVALQILDRDNESVILGPHGAALLGQPWIMRFVEHHKYFYRDLEDPVAMLRGEQREGGLRSYWSYEEPSADKTAYSALMAASQAAVSTQILGAYDFSSHRHILDVGGGSGAFLRAVATRYPHLDCHLFDLPGVVALAKSDPGQKLTCHGGDFRRDPLPAGMDVISIVRVLHDHDDDAVMALLRNVRAACDSTSVLLIAEPFSGLPATARVTDAYFSLYFAAMGQGRTRTPQDITEMAIQAGFERPRQWTTDMPLITGVMTFWPRTTGV